MFYSYTIWRFFFNYKNINKTKFKKALYLYQINSNILLIFFRIKLLLHYMYIIYFKNFLNIFLFFVQFILNRFTKNKTIWRSNFPNRRNLFKWNDVLVINVGSHPYNKVTRCLCVCVCVCVSVCAVGSR